MPDPLIGVVQFSRSVHSFVLLWRQADYESFSGRKVGDTRFGLTLMARWASSQSSTAKRQHPCRALNRRLSPTNCSDSITTHGVPQWLRSEHEPIPGAQRARLIVVAVVCILYPLNLTGGWIEIPDCLPVVGNLDEVAATVVLMRCLRWVGFSVMPRYR